MFRITPKLADRDTASSQTCAPDRPELAVAFLCVLPIIEGTALLIIRYVQRAEYRRRAVERLEAAFSFGESRPSMWPGR